MCGVRQIRSESSGKECECGGVRKMLTNQEKREKLKNYQKDLEQELVAVKETMQSLAQII